MLKHNRLLQTEFSTVLPTQIPDFFFFCLQLLLVRLYDMTHVRSGVKPTGRLWDNKGHLLLYMMIYILHTLS